MAQDENVNVLVIGAGPAGIASAYALEQANISYKVVDRATEIASTWNSLYPSLRLNTSRFFSHMTGQKFPLHYGLFPTGKQYHVYLREYVKDHDFNIQLGVSVTRVSQDGEGWRVEMDTPDGPASEWVPCVISASGRFGKPLLPNIDGRDDFAGELIYAHDYKGPDAYRGKRVMVVGNGPSGVDIATELGDYAQTPVLLSQRTGVVLRPMYPYGLPKHAWLILSEMLPDWIGKPLYKHVTNATYSEKNLRGIKTPGPDTMTTSARGTRGRGLINAVQAGKVISVDGPTQFHANSVTVANGDTHEVDAVIMGTGYAPVLYDYLDIDINERDSQDWPSRLDVLDEGGMRQVKGYPGLFLVGVFYKGKGAMYNFNTEAEQATREIQERLNTLRHLENA